uniref:Uncharacterized protein n=1 Tax=Anguilla anguilla TaxID=7936 RepID=A0A0E9UX19_ANGAN
MPCYWLMKNMSQSHRPFHKENGSHNAAENYFTEKLVKSKVDFFLCKNVGFFISAPDF